MRRLRQEESLDLTFGFIGEFVVLEIALYLTIGLTLARHHHGVEESTEESRTSSCWRYDDKVALSDGGWSVGHGSSPFVGLDDPIGASHFLIVVTSYISAVRCFDHA
jgi:hypothetical protein